MGTLICLLIAYPLAYFLAVQSRPPRAGCSCSVLVIVPFWTSLLIRTYAWMFILGGEGIPALLGWIGIADIRLINTPFAVLIGIVYGYLPLMVFPIFVSLEKLDKRLLEASADLGAAPFATFLPGDPAALAARRHHRLHAGLHPADGRVPDPAAPRRRQGLLHRQCAGRPLPAIAQLALRLGLSPWPSSPSCW